MLSYIYQCFCLSVADPDPESGIGFFRILNPYFWELGNHFSGKKYYNYWWIGLNFFSYLLKNKIIYNFVIFVAAKKVGQQFFPLLFCCCCLVRDLGSGMDKSQDSGSGINISDPQHCFCLSGQYLKELMGFLFHFIPPLLCQKVTVSPVL